MRKDWLRWTGMLLVGAAVFGQFLLNAHQMERGGMVRAMPAEGRTEGAWEETTEAGDTEPPKLVSFELAATDYSYYETEDGARTDYYYEGQIPDGLQGSFVVEEEGTEPVCAALKAVETETGTEHTFTSEEGDDFFLEQEENVFRFTLRAAGSYRLVFEAQDAAGNRLAAGDELSLADGDTFSEGCFCSHPVVTGARAAVLRAVEYEKPAQVVGADGETAEETMTVVPGYTAYYAAAPLVTVTLGGKELTSEDLEAFWADAEGNALEEVDWTAWEEEDGKYSGSFRLSEREGVSRLVLRGTEDTDLLLWEEAADAVKKSFSRGEARGDSAYCGGSLVLDRTDPVVTFTLSDGTSAAERVYYDQTIGAKVVIAERNFRVRETELDFTGEAVDSAGREVTAASAHLEEWNRCLHDAGNWVQEGEDIWACYLEALPEDANYTVELSYRDLAGREASPEGGSALSLLFTVDREEPVLSDVAYLEAESGEKAEYIPYSTWRYYAGERIRVRFTCTDATGGVGQCIYYAKDADGQRVAVTAESETISETGEKAAVSFLLPENFKGFVTVGACDLAGNRTEETSAGLVSEDGSCHLGKAEISVQPSALPNKNGFYRDNFRVKFRIRDSHSGIRSYAYQAGAGKEGTEDFGAKALKNKTKARVAERYVWERTETVQAEENEDDEGVVSLSFTDNAGNVSSLRETFRVDATAPTVTVTYDNYRARNGRYYREPRVATITVTEENFAEEDFQVLCTAEGGAARMSGWKHEGTGKTARHICQVIFSEDGDYTLTVEGEDRAGNPLSYHRVDAFTIDRTKPVAAVDWGDARPASGRYYSAVRTARVTVTEHNFSAEDTKLAVVSRTEAQELSEEETGEFRAAGDRHSRTLSFAEDGEYRMELSVCDLAGNEAEIYREDWFVVDRTKPQIRIAGVEEDGAYSGSVRPVVACTDRYIDGEKTTVNLYGYKNGKRNTGKEREAAADTVSVRLSSFQKLRKCDDIYEIVVNACDLAGNRSHRTLLFTVNRFGARYRLDAGTEEMIARKYITEEGDVGITETNVDTAVETEVRLIKDGEIRQLEEGEDYTLTEGTDENRWPERYFLFSGDCFAQEGSYGVLLYSKDRAGNRSDNAGKGVPIEFTVDKTAPSATVSGVEDGGEYTAASRLITAAVRDNVGLAGASLFLNGEETRYEGAELAEKNGLIQVEASAGEGQQEIVIRACDYAGNVYDSGTKSFRITEKEDGKVYHDRRFPYALAFGGGALLFLVILLVGWRWRRV